MLTCKEFDDFMVDYLDGNLPAWQTFMCWLHVKMCRACAQFVNEYRRTMKLGKTAFENSEDEVPDSVPEELIKAALAYRKPPQED
jgi:anti-sigma factor RsiW